MQASLYDLYDMLSLCADEASGPGASGGPLDTEALAVCVRTLEAIGRGTDAQVGV
jgi:hypothetical protein